MPAPTRHQTDAAEALAAVAPLATRWIERLLTQGETPLTMTQYLALRAIAREQISSAELARRAGVSGPAVSQLLSGLTEADLVVRRPMEVDRRRQELTLSPAGEAALEGAGGLLRGELGALLADLPRPEVDALSRLLPRVEAALAGTPPPRPSKPPRHHGPGKPRGPRK
jgi:DNA-binding MarR family transcriptional regulator